ncbi:hypothetical protein HYV89_02430 [Candidatus Woesearchaeota archaeon]|nr:hypothetical protein [Candidatus Woesearchaeota archaeon]
MGRLGTYFVPDILVSQAIEITKTIYKENIGSEEALARKLGHKAPEGGGYNRKLVTLRQLGVIKSGIKGIELTPLGTKIARPLGNEQKQAYNELISHLPLFIELRKKLRGKTPDKEGMLLALLDIVKVDRGVIDKEVFGIQKIYNDAEKYILPTSDNLISDEGGINMATNDTEDPQLLEIKMGQLYMRLPKNIEAIEQAEIMLNAQKEAIKKKANKK